MLRSGAAGYFLAFGGDVGTLGPAKVFNVGRSRVDIAHAFVEAHVNGILDTAGFEVAPEYNLRGVGGHPRKMPRFAWRASLAERFPGGRTQTRQPKVRRLVKSSWCLAHHEVGESSVP